MAQTLSTVTSGHFLAPTDKATDTVVQRLWAVMRESDNFRHDAITDRLAPTEAERGMLARRLDQVSHHLTPAKAAAIKRSVGMVKGLMASTSVDGQSAGAILDGYAMVLAPYPQALIEDVCTRFLDGRLGNRVYAPTPAEIAHECRSNPDLIAARAERYRLEAILSAEVYQTPSPEEQAEIQAEYQRYVDEAGKSSKMTLQVGEEPRGSEAADRVQARRDLAERLERSEAERKARITERENDEAPAS
jgi:hypothetical protein